MPIKQGQPAPRKPPSRGGGENERTVGHLGKKKPFPQTQKEIQLKGIQKKKAQKKINTRLS